MEKAKKQRKMSVMEIILVSIAGALVIWGLVEIILGLICDFYPGVHSQNPLWEAQEAYKALFGLGFLGWGMILFGIGIGFGAIVLVAYSYSRDRETEKASRRAARLGKPVTTPDQVVDAEVNEVK